MNAHEPKPASEDDTGALGTLGWVAVVALGAVFALLFLSWLGPVGAR